MENEETVHSDSMLTEPSDQQTTHATRNLPEDWPGDSMQPEGMTPDITGGSMPPTTSYDQAFINEYQSIPSTSDALSMTTPGTTPTPQAEPAKKKPLIAIIAIACALAATAAAFAIVPNLDGGTESEPEQTSHLVLFMDESASIILNVEAEGYDSDSTPIMFHLTGKPDDESLPAIDEFGIIEAPSSSGELSKAAGKDIGGNAIKLTIDGIPAGSYEVNWSNAILSDGSYFQVPKNSKVVVASDDTADVMATFVKVDGSKAKAEDVKAAYESIVTWLKSASGDIAKQVDSILKLAKFNAEKAPAVVEVGGLDKVGVKEEPKNTDQTDDGVVLNQSDATYSEQPSQKPKSQSSSSSSSSSSSDDEDEDWDDEDYYDDWDDEEYYDDWDDEEYYDDWDDEDYYDDWDDEDYYYDDEDYYDDWDDEDWEEE